MSNTVITLGSLFDGSGGFPLAGMMHGITPIWASEIEPYPLKVTAARLPQMKQLGDVKKIHGAKIAPVDIITFGSPCQDLSVAGKQKGIHDGDRSSLFFDAIRIIKEMRDARADKFPRFCVWENVPGAFSSNRGEDFRAVLEAISGIAEEGVSIPRPPKSKWDHAGYVVSDGWSIAWRVYDAQYWGVPQRRKRIYLIADFGSERAGEILFKQESLCRDPAEGGTEGKGTAADAEGSAGRSSISAGFAGKQGANSLMATDYIEPQCVAYALEGNTIDRKNGQNGKGYCESVSPTLNTQDLHGVCYGIDQQGGKGGENFTENVMPTLCSDSHGTPHGVCYAPNGNHCGNYEEADISAILQTSYHYENGGDGALVVEPMSIGNGQMHNMAMSKIANTLDCMHDPQAILMDGKPKRKYIVRRLTPLECCRLQGFPDWWEEGVEGSDSARYRMWGNGIALPCAADVLGRIAKELRRCGR